MVQQCTKILEQTEKEKGSLNSCSFTSVITAVIWDMLALEVMSFCFFKCNPLCEY